MTTHPSTGSTGPLDWREREAHLQQVRQEVKALPRERASLPPKIALGVATLIWLGVLVWEAVTLPERVPTHWTTGPIPDGWGSRTEELVMSTLMPLLFAYPMVLMSRLALVWPDGINMPRKEWWLWTARRLNRFERLLREDMMWFAALMVCFFSAMMVQVGLASRRPDGASPPWSFWLLLGVFLAATLAWTLRLSTGSRYAPREDDPELA